MIGIDICESCYESCRSFVYEGRRKLCFRCHSYQRLERKELILQMRDVRSRPPLGIFFYRPDLARIDERWRAPLSYQYLN